MDFMAALPLRSKEVLHLFFPPLQDEKRLRPSCAQLRRATEPQPPEGTDDGGTQGCTARKSLGLQEPLPGFTFHEAVSVIMLTDYICQSLNNDTKKQGGSYFICYQRDIIIEYFGKITAGKEKLQPEAQICSVTHGMQYRHYV